MNENNPLLDNLEQIAGSRKLALEALRQEGRHGEKPSLTDMLVYVLQKRGQTRVLYKQEVFPETFQQEEEKRFFRGRKEDRELTDFRPPSGGAGDLENPSSNSDP